MNYSNKVKTDFVSNKDKTDFVSNKDKTGFVTSDDTFRKNESHDANRNLSHRRMSYFVLFFMIFSCSCFSFEYIEFDASDANMNVFYTSDDCLLLSFKQETYGPIRLVKLSPSGEFLTDTLITVDESGSTSMSILTELEPNRFLCSFTIVGGERSFFWLNGDGEVLARFDFEYPFEHENWSLSFYENNLYSFAQDRIYSSIYSRFDTLGNLLNSSIIPAPSSPDISQFILLHSLYSKNHELIVLNYLVDYADGMYYDYRNHIKILDYDGVLVDSVTTEISSDYWVHSFSETIDSGFVYVHVAPTVEPVASDTFIVTKYDGSLDLIWTKKIYCENISYPTGFANCNDGSMYVLAKYTTDTLSLEGLRIVKLNSMGDFIDSEELFAPTLNQFAHLKKLPDDDIIVYGQVDSEINFLSSIDKESLILEDITSDNVFQNSDDDTHYFVMTPNPCSDVCHFAFTTSTGNTEINYSLYDITGRNVLSAVSTTGDFQLNLKDNDKINNGVYYVRLSFGEQVVNRKLIVIK